LVVVAVVTREPTYQKEMMAARVAAQQQELLAGKDLEPLTKVLMGLLVTAQLAAEAAVHHKQDLQGHPASVVRVAMALHLLLLVHQ